MAKISSSLDIASYSQLVNLFGAPTATALREWGAIEYDTTLSINSSGAKVLSPYDLSSYSQLVNMAGTTPTTGDMWGATVLGAQREWGALEYNSAIAFVVSPKLVSPFDLAGYSKLINYYRNNVNPYLPTRTDLRGITAPSNAGFTRSNPGFLPTTQDARTTTATGGIRELGALEYDTSLVIDTDALSSTEIANAVWQTTRTTLVGTLETAGAFVASLATRTATAQAGASTTITLDANASSVDSFYNNQYIVILSGTGVGQARLVSSYVGSTRVATVDSAWSTNPDSTSVFATIPFITVPSAATVADAVWDEATADHATSATFGEKTGKKLLTTSNFLGLK